MILPPLDCAGCRKCCEGDVVPLMEGDNSRLYKTIERNGVEVLRRRHGNCVYLGPKGCRLHGRVPKPQLCQAMDCREYYLRHERDGDLRERLADPHLREVLLEGRRRVNALRREIA